jgi:hypothetical protein
MKISARYFVIFINCLLLVFLAALQLGAVAAWPFPFNNVDLVVVSLVFLLLIINWQTTMLWVLGTGLILDFYSFHFVGVNLVSLMVAVLASNFLLNHFFTNRSLYSFFAITTAAYFLRILVFYSAIFLLAALGQTDVGININSYFFLGKFYGLLISWIIVWLLFNCLAFISRRFKPFFLTARK